MSIKAAVVQTIADIETERLLLRPLVPVVLESTVAGAQREVAEQLALSVPQEWFASTGIAQIRLDDLRVDSGYQEWSLRAVAEKVSRQMVGHIEFHTRPGADYLAPWAPEGVELGYTIYPAFRRQGYAREAIGGMVAWASGAKGISQFIVSIAPGNTPSIALATVLSFVPVGTHQDEVDGEEVVLRLSDDALQRLLGSP
jgi:[ribosomal protein S5]-alanine N-acetyltransferase